MTRTHFISVVIPVKNNPVGIRRVLRSLKVARKRSPVPVEFVVVDDGSTDHTADMARQEGARVVRTPGYGYRMGSQVFDVGKVRNTGLRAAKGDVIASIDADCKVGPDYFRRIVAVMEHHDLVALDLRPLETSDGQIVYKRFFDALLELTTGGASEPSLIFRRSVICPSNNCFTDQGHAEILGVTNGHEHRMVKDPHNPVYTDFGGWRETVGWALWTAVLAAFGGGIAWLAIREPK